MHQRRAAVEARAEHLPKLSFGKGLAGAGLDAPESSLKAPVSP